jgi:hypothetical protein
MTGFITRATPIATPVLFCASRVHDLAGIFALAASVFGDCQKEIPAKRSYQENGHDPAPGRKEEPSDFK